MAYQWIDHEDVSLCDMTGDFRRGDVIVVKPIDEIIKRRLSGWPTIPKNGSIICIAAIGGDVFAGLLN